MEVNEVEHSAHSECNQKEHQQVGTDGQVNLGFAANTVAPLIIFSVTIVITTHFIIIINL
jgi:hypothetical protein